MKKILVLAALLASVAPALAADNIPVTAGAGTPIRSTDTSAGATGAGPYVNWYTLSTSGAAGTAPVVLYGTAGVPAANPLTVQGIASMTPLLVTLSGTNNINNISGAVSLPTGASTSALQPTNAAIGSTTSGETGHLVMGAVTTAAPTYTTAQTNPLSLDTAGNLRTNCVAGCAAGSTSNASSGVATSSTNGATVAYNYGFNGTTWDQLQVDGSKNLKVNVTNANANGRATSANSSPVVPSSAPTTYHVIWPANVTGILVSTGVHTLMSCQMSNNSTTAAYLKIYNKATAPTTGTDTPIVTAIIPGPAAGGGGSNIQFGPGGLAISLGLGVAVTTVITDADTTAPAASTLAINCQYD